MARHFGDYPVEDLRVPVLILHAEDDKPADYDAVSRALFRFPGDTGFVSFETMRGNEVEIKRKVTEFMEKQRRQTP